MSFLMTGRRERRAFRALRRRAARQKSVPHDGVCA